MLENTTGFASVSISVGAVACLTCLLVMMGLKLKWFRARMTFDQPQPEQVAFVGVYRSNFSASFGDFDSAPAPTSVFASSPPLPSSTRPVSSPPFITPNKMTSSGFSAASTLSLVDETQATKKAKQVKQKETKVKAVATLKVAKPAKEEAPKEPKPPKQVKAKEPKAVKEVKPKEQKASKDVKVKEPKSAKEPKPKEQKALKDVKAKEPKALKVKPTKDSNKNAANGLAAAGPTPKNGFPFEAAGSETVSKPSPMQAHDESSLPDDGAFTFVQVKATASQNVESLMPSPAMKTFGSMQPTKGQVNTRITPIPQKENNRGFRNPAAMGMNKYVSPSEKHMFFDMEEESET